MFVHILPENVRKLIAAGEVIETPVDVVKELVENSLDAKSTKIEVEISKGGKRYIRVKDNGTGIHPEDLEKVILQGATSKIKDEKDLLKISSYGFRGEALFSIASVSKLTIRSRFFQEKEWYQIEVVEGKVVSKKKVGMEIGTEVIVRDLFFNLPVRKKFLPKEDTERKKILELIKVYSLVNSNVNFELVSNGKRLLKLTSSDYIDRARELFGVNFEVIEEEREFLKVKALISRNYPRGKMYLFVNSRPVDSRGLKEFLRKILGYKTLAIIFVDLPPFLVDFNVHPKKRDIKFLKERKTLSLLKDVLTGRSYELEVPFLAQSKEKYRPRYHLIGQMDNTVIVARIDDYVYFFDQHLLSERINYEEGEDETKACRVSVKAGEALSEEEMKRLIERWFSLENPHVCPHGRPMYYRIPIKQIYEALGREF